MFLFAITKYEIAHNFKSVNIEELKINSSIATIVTDNILSKFFLKQDGFSVIESPLLSCSDEEKIFFSQVKYNENDKTFDILKSTISGRPIYYNLNSKGDFFCSSHISLLRKAGVTIEENTDVLPEFFVYRWIMPPSTLYKNINHLFTGGCLRIRITNGKCKIKSLDHYDPPIQNQNIRSIKNCSKIFFDYLCGSIEKLNPRKEEIATLLSGGIDSSVTSVICKDKLGIANSYSTGYPFEEPELNFEKIYALSGAKALGFDHHYYEPSAKEYLHGFLEAITLAEEPLHHLQSVLMHLLFKNGIPNDKRIIVHGQGAGFSFGNVTSYLFMKDKIIIKLLARKPLKELYMTASHITGKGKEYVDLLNQCSINYPLSNPNNPIWSWHDFGSQKWVCDYFKVTEEDIIKGKYNLIRQFNNKSIYDIWSLYSLLGDEDSTLPIWTKLGEGNNKILYSPFYDVNVLNYVFSIPWKLKLREPKNILRCEIARRAHIPELIINRPKKSFGIHPDRWANKGGVFEPLIPLASKIFDENEIRKMQSPESKKAMTYWNMLNYSIWRRLCIDNEPLDLLLDELG